MSLNDYDSKELNSPFPVRLNEGLVQKNIGYCSVHSYEKPEKHSNHGHNHDHHDHSHHDHSHHEHKHEHAHAHDHGGCSHNHGNQ